MQQQPILPTFFQLEFPSSGTAQLSRRVEPITRLSLLFILPIIFRTWKFRKSSLTLSLRIKKFVLLFFATGVTSNLETKRDREMDTVISDMPVVVAWFLSVVILEAMKSRDPFLWKKAPINNVSDGRKGERIKLLFALFSHPSRFPDRNVKSRRMRDAFTLLKRC